MQPLIPKTKAAEVLEKIAVINQARNGVDPFTVARLRREARESMAVDPIAAHMALGALASFEWDDAELDRHHLAAIRLSDTDVTRKNYAISLALVQRIGDAWQQLKQASHDAPGSLSTLDAAIGAAYTAGEFAAAKLLCDDFAKRSPEPHRRSQHVAQLARIVEQRGVTAETTTKMVDIAYGVLKDARIDNQAMRIRAFDDSYDCSLMYIVYVKTSRDEIAKLEQTLADRLFDTVDELDLSAFWIGYEEESEIDLETFDAH